MTTLFYLTGSLKLKMQEVWVKSLRFIGRGFSIDKYYELKEYKFSLEYKSLFTYLSKNMMPSQFQEEMGIPKIVYEIGEHFPLVASLSGRFFDSPPKYAHDDLETIAPTTLFLLQNLPCLLILPLRFCHRQRKSAMKMI